jgi:hypothetical protein
MADCSNCHGRLAKVDRAVICHKCKGVFCYSCAVMHFKRGCKFTESEGETFEEIYDSI